MISQPASGRLTAPPSVRSQHPRSVEQLDRPATPARSAAPGHDQTSPRSLERPLRGFRPSNASEGFRWWSLLDRRAGKTTRSLFWIGGISDSPSVLLLLVPGGHVV